MGMRVQIFKKLLGPKIKHTISTGTSFLTTDLDAYVRSTSGDCIETPTQELLI